jgi:hypothetical protein
VKIEPACTTNLVRFSVLLVVVALFVPGPGCANQQYYRVTDPQTNEVYYTQQIRHPNAGSATFKDIRTGKSVTLERMKIDTLDAQQYRAETGGGGATTP